MQPSVLHTVQLYIPLSALLTVCMVKNGAVCFKTRPFLYQVTFGSGTASALHFNSSVSPTVFFTIFDISFGKCGTVCFG